jgi:hypothetical protein
VVTRARVVGGGWWVVRNSRLLLTDCCCGDKLFVKAKMTSQIALCFTLKSFENPKSFYSFFRILKFDFRREIGKTEFWCLTGLLWSGTCELEIGFRLAGSVDVSMLELMLTHDVNPNCSFGGQSKWRLYLEAFANDALERKEYNVFDCVKVMLRANFKQKCTLDSETLDQREIRAPGG